MVIIYNDPSAEDTDEQQLGETLWLRYNNVRKFIEASLAKDINHEHSPLAAVFFNSFWWDCAASGIFLESTEREQSLIGPAFK